MRAPRRAASWGLAQRRRGEACGRSSRVLAGGACKTLARSGGLICGASFVKLVLHTKNGTVVSKWKSMRYLGRACAAARARSS
jgi:hypothetical protein